MAINLGISQVKGRQTDHKQMVTHRMISGGSCCHDLLVILPLYMVVIDGDNKELSLVIVENDERTVEAIALASAQAMWLRRRHSSSKTECDHLCYFLTHGPL